MAKQNPQAGATGATGTEKKKRTPRKLPADLQLKVDEMRVQLKEARALAKPLEAIPNLQRWGCEKVKAALEERMLLLD